MFLDDMVDAMANGILKLDTPTWYVTQSGDIKGVIRHDEVDTCQYRRMAEAQYPGCTVWTKNTLGWCSMPVDNLRFSIWHPGTPPDVVLLAGLLEI